MKEKRRFQGPADSIPPRAKLELRVPRAPSGKLDARPKPTSRRPASWRVPRKKRLETLPFAQFANLAARLRRRVPLRPRDRLDAPTSALSRFRAPDGPLRVSRLSNAARNLDAPLSAFPAARALRVPVHVRVPSSPCAFLDAPRDSERFRRAAAPRDSASALFAAPDATPPTFSTPAFFSPPRRASLRVPESPNADLPTAPVDALRNPRAESSPSPRTFLSAADVPDAAPRFEATGFFDAPRGTAPLPLSAPSANPTRSRDAAAFGKDALLSAPNETFAPTLRRVESRFGTGRRRREGGVEERRDTIDVANDSVAETRRSTIREEDDSVSSKDALFFDNTMNYGASSQPNGMIKRGSSVFESLTDSSGLPLRSVVNWRFQTKSASRDATGSEPTSPEGFETRRFALDRVDRGVSTLGADALEGRERFREEAWGASFAGRGSVETTRSATLGSSSGRRAAPTQWPMTETPRESANLATIERLLKESRDALVNLARDSKGDWTLDVE